MLELIQEVRTFHFLLVSKINLVCQHSDIWVHYVQINSLLYGEVFESNKLEKCEKLKIINLCFADDLMFMRGDFGSVRLIMEKLNCFSNATGLQATVSKSKVFLGGVHEGVEQQIIHCTGFVSGCLPVKYLGVPLASRKLMVNMCQSLIDKIVVRIKQWTARLLRYAGRCQLIKSVLFSIAKILASGVSSTQESD